MTAWETAEREADLLVERGLRWAVLHGAPRLNAGVVETDVDFACDVDGPAIVRQLRSGLQTSGLCVIMMRRYDIGKAHNFWVSSVEGRSLVQFDVLCDAHGIGKLGIPTGLALGRLDSRRPFPSVRPEWSLGYEVSKRLSKRQWNRLEQLSARTPFEVPVRPVLSEVFGETAGDRAWDLLAAGADAAKWRRWSPLLRAGRLSRRARRARGTVAGLARARVERVLSRLARPAGFWVHYHGTRSSDVAKRVHTAIARQLPASFLGEVRNGAFPVGSMASIVPVLMRAGLAVTWSSDRRKWPLVRPHLEAEIGCAPDPSRAEEELVAAMARRLEARVGSVSGCSSRPRSAPRP